MLSTARTCTLACPAVWSIAWCVAGCAAPPAATVDARPQLVRSLTPWSIEPTSAATAVGTLAWQSPTDACAQVYRITVAYEPDLKFEEDSVSFLALGLDPKREGDLGDGAGPIPVDSVVGGRLFYQGLRAERDGATRDVSYGRTAFGPAAPTAACLPQTWDPMEDAFALAWPRLPGRLTAVGEHWNGLRVEAKCNRAACVDPKTGGGGPDNHHRTCVTQDWQESLLGLYEVDGQRLAWLHSTWTDGHGGEGIDTERFTLVSIDHGRPVWSQTIVDHRFAQPTADGAFAPVVKTWQLEAIDDCPGSLSDLGWTRDETTIADANRIAQELARSDELRRNNRKKRKIEARMKAQDERRQEGGDAPPAGDEMNPLSPPLVTPAGETRPVVVTPRPEE
jgi:hypothetical protein